MTVVGSKGDLGPRVRDVYSTTDNRHRQAHAQVRSGPTADSCIATIGGLFDHLIGAGEHCFRNGKTNDFRGLEIDRRVEFSWLRYSIARVLPKTQPSSLNRCSKAAAHSFMVEDDPDPR